MHVGGAAIYLFWIFIHIYLIIILLKSASMFVDLFEA